MIGGPGKVNSAGSLTSCGAPAGRFMNREPPLPEGANRPAGAGPGAYFSFRIPALDMISRTITRRSSILATTSSGAM